MKQSNGSITLCLWFYQSLLLISYIDCLKSEKNLCSIQLYVSDARLNRIVPGSDGVELFSNTEYIVNCTTSESVRRNSILSLTNKNTNEVTVISRTTNGSTTTGRLEIADTSMNSTRDAFNLYCRFLTVDPNIYCEADIRVFVVASPVRGFYLILVILSVAVLIATVNFVARLCLKVLRSDSSNEYSLSHCKAAIEENCEMERVTRPYQIFIKEPIYENDWDFVCRSERSFKF